MIIFLLDVGFGFIYIQYRLTQRGEIKFACSSGK